MPEEKKNKIKYNKKSKHTPLSPVDRTNCNCPLVFFRLFVGCSYRCERTASLIDLRLPQDASRETLAKWLGKIGGHRSTEKE